MTGSHRFRAAWTRGFVLGELLGFVPPALTGSLLAWGGAGDPVMVLGLAVAGLLEGAALGHFQAAVLSRFAPSLDGGAWRRATILSAGLAWLVGMGGGSLMGASDGDLRLLVVLVPAWLAGLLAMGFLQWLELRRRFPACRRWILVSAGAWMVGVAIPVVALSAVPSSWPMVAHFVVGMVSAVAMGVSTGRLTGGSLARLLRLESYGLDGEFIAGAGRSGPPQRPPGRIESRIVSLGILREPEQLTVLLLAVALLVLQGLVSNSFAGIPYPLWTATAAS